MATIYVDNLAYEVRPGDNLLHACLSLGLDIPYFCWHPALGAVGACRQCAVKQYKDEHDTRGRIVMSCQTAATDGARISIDDPEARAFRGGVIAWLMANHPHDCPVCDEGGECHLQDMTVMTGHTHRRYRFKKRTFTNQNLGPFLNHEMNRCIQCYRCVRFYRDYAGGRDFQAVSLRDQVYFGRHQDGALESEFSGNLVEVCPTGVFTDKTFKRHYTRKWDLQTAPSVCVHCGLGCNITPGERSGTLRRIHNRYNGEVNGYFLCDRGRYGYEFVNGEKRIRRPLLRGIPADKSEVLRHLGRVLENKGKIIGIGSPRATLEANFALRTLVGTDRFYTGMSEAEGRLVAAMAHILAGGQVRSPSLHDVGQADAVLVLGEDVSNTAPRLALSLRQSARHPALAAADKLGIPRWDDGAVRVATAGMPGSLFIATPTATRLDDAASMTFRAAPDDLARLGFAIARELNLEYPAAPDLDSETRALACTIADALRRARRPLVVSGAGCGSFAIIEAAASVAAALSNDSRATELCYAMPECNSLGLALMGGGTLAEAFRAVAEGDADTLVILENDLFRRAEHAAVHALLDKAKHVVAIDHLGHETTLRAEVALPAGTFAENSGTVVNHEGRAQRFFRVLAPKGDVQESWRWLRDLMQATGRDEGDAWQCLDDVTKACAQAIPSLTAITDAAPTADFRIHGAKVPRQPPRYSGRTADLAQISVHEPLPPQDIDSPLTFSMEGYYGRMPPALIPYFRASGWNSVQAVNKFQNEVASELAGGDPGVRLIEPAAGQALRTVVIPDAFRPRPGEWLVLPLHHVFGSEELSALAPAVAELAPLPYLAVNAEDAAELGIVAGAVLELALAGSSHRLPVRPRPDLPRGVAGLPAGISAWMELPAWGRISVANSDGGRRE